MPVSPPAPAGTKCLRPPQAQRQASEGRTPVARAARIAGFLATCALLSWLPSVPAGGQVPLPGQSGSSSETWSPSVESQNYAKTQERQTIYDTPQYQAQLRTQSQANSMAANQIMLNDPGREFATDLCWNQSDGCAGDVRLYN